MFTRIVVAYDDSPGARRALAEALDLAHRGEGVELTVVAVEEHLPHYGATIGEVNDEHQIAQQTCRRWLHAATATAAEHDITLNTDIRAGHPAHQLAAAADDHNADLLILGRTSHSTIRDRLIGSTAENSAATPTAPYSSSTEPRPQRFPRRARTDHHANL